MYRVAGVAIGVVWCGGEEVVGSGGRVTGGAKSLWLAPP